MERNKKKKGWQRFKISFLYLLTKPLFFFFFCPPLALTPMLVKKTDNVFSDRQHRSRSSAARPTAGGDGAAGGPTATETGTR